MAALRPMVPFDDRWMVSAACRGMAPELFFPERDVAGAADLAAARAVCVACVVQVSCRAYALAAGDQLAGVWAGTSQKQRRPMRRQQREVVS